MYHIVGWVIRDESLAARHIVTLGSAPLQLDESEFWRGPRTGRFVDRIRASVVHKL
jgi:hypothetical protein